MASCAANSKVVKNWREHPPCSYSLKIDKLSQFNLDKYESRRFLSGGYNWRLVIYPEGNENDNGSGLISMYVEFDNTCLSSTSPMEVFAYLVFFVFNKKKENKYFTIQDNLNGAQVLGRVIKVDHCGKYVKREEEDEETQRHNREARGVCRAFQRGECTRGDSWKFSHDEKRAANTGWGHEEDRSSRWDHDKFNGAKKGGTSFGHREDFKPDAEEKSYREKFSL